MKVVAVGLGGALVLPVVVSMVLAFGIAAASEGVLSVFGLGVPGNGDGVRC